MTKPLLYSVLPRPPHATRDGLAIRNYHLLESLSREFRVKSFTLLPTHLAGEPSEYPPAVVVATVPHGSRRLRQAAALGAGLFAGAAFPEVLYHSRRLIARLSRLAAEEKPAWIVAHSYHVGPAALASGHPAWIDFHNVDSEIWRRMGETAASPLARAFARSQSPRVAEFERRLVRGASGISCVSGRDAEHLAAFGSRSAPLVVPNGVDLSRYRFRGAPPAGEVVLFVGDLGWPPNAEGMRWFRAEVWPEIRRLRPNARAEIVGRNAAPSLLREESPDFAFLGDLGDTRPRWQAASVAVVPLRAGGGTRLKILEAAAAGAPVVSTPLGAEGLELDGGTEILLAEDARSFAAAVAALLSAPAAAAKQARAARARVEKLYGWEAIGRRFAADLLARARRRA